MESFRRAAAAAFVLAVILGLHAESALAACNVSVAQSIPCLPFVWGWWATGDSPSAVCCFLIARADFRCLCSYKNSRWLQWVTGLNPKAVAKLPYSCQFIPKEC